MGSDFRKRSRLRAALLASTALVGVSIGPASAQQFFNGSQTSPNGVINGGGGPWDNVTPNWTNSAGASSNTYDPAAATVTVFGASGTSTPAAGGTVAVDPGGVQLTGTLQFRATGNNSIYTIAGPGVLSVATGGTTFDVGNVSGGTAPSAVIAATIDGVDAVTKTGAGTLTLTGANTYSGGTTIQSGTVSISQLSAFSGPTHVSSGVGLGAVTLDGGKLVTTSTGSLANDLTFADSKTSILAAATGTTLTLGGNASTGNFNTAINIGAGATAQFGSASETGTIVVGRSALISFGSVDPTASIVVAGGTLQDFQDQLSFLTAGAASTTVNAGATLDFNDSVIQFVNNLKGAGNVLTGATASANPSQDLQLSIGDGTTNLFSGVISGARGVFLATFGSNGTQIFAGDNTYTGGTTICSCTTLQLGNGGTTGSILGNVFNGGTLVFNRSNTYVFAGDISDDGPDPGKVIQDGTGTTVLTGTNTYSNGTEVKRGALIVGNGGTAGSISGDVTVDAGATFGINKSDQYMLINQISGAGGFAQLGTGTTIFASNFINYTGTTTIAAGTLQVGNGGSEGSIGNGDILNNATLAINLGGISPFVLPNNISGTGELEQIGPGTTQLTGTNTYSGATNVNAGTLQAGAANTFSPNSTHNVLSGGVLDLNNFNQTIGALSGEGDVTLGSGSLDTGGNNASTTFAGVIAGSGGLTKSGTGTFTLAGANLHGGGTTLAGGVLSVSADANLGAAAGALSFNGGTLQVTGTAFNTTARAVNWSAAGGIFDIVAAGNSFTVTSAIGAGGALTKIGTGTLVLAGATSYAGATNVNAGTLQAGAANAFSGSSAFTVASGATLNLAGFNQTIGSLAGTGTVGFGAGVLTTGGDNTSTTFAGVASGSGGLTKAGTGTFTLTGSNTYTGTTTVNAGTLSVNGAIAGPVTVNSGATLGGTGTIGSTTVNNGGVFAPGNSIGTITVNGNLVLGAGSIYRVELSPTSSDRTNVTGSATLGGTAQLLFGPGSYAQHSYTILSAAGGRIGTFENVAVEGLPATLTASLSYTSTDVLLATLTSQIEPVLPKFLSGVTPNQRSVAAAQDKAFNGALPSITALYNLSLAQLPAALDALSGEVHASTAGALVDESLYVRSAVLGRLRQASYGGNTGMAPLATGGPQVAFADEEIDAALAYAKSPIVSKAPLKAPEASRDIVFWAQGFGAWGRFDGDGNAASVRRDLAGFITGLDTRVGESGRAGIAAGYTGSRNNLDGRGSANVETGHIAAYGGWSFGALNLRAGGAYAFHSIDTDRTVAFPGFNDRLTARYDGGTGQVFGEVGYGFAFGNVAVEPFAGGAWVRLDTDGTTERGGAAALNVSSNRFEVGYSTLGIRAASLIPIGDGMVLIPRAAAAWQHAFDGVTPESRLAFQASAVPFVIAGVPIARDSLLAEAGLDLAIGRNATLGVSYTGQLARNVHDHAAKGKFSWRF